jgi:thiamine-phosphate pyrophosphorylase
LNTQRTAKPILCYVTDRLALPAHDERGRSAALLDRMRRAAEAGVDWIQLREKDLVAARPLLDLARGAVAPARAAGNTTRILINDRLDVAWAAEADGVHLGESSLPAREVMLEKRRRGQNEFLVGVSCHSLEAARQAAEDGADYIFFGPVFATPSKAAFGPAQGLGRLGEVCSAVRIPVLAIGGITAANAAASLDAGAAGLAGIRLFQEAASMGALLAVIR